MAVFTIVGANSKCDLRCALKCKISAWKKRKNVKCLNNIVYFYMFKEYIEYTE